MKSTVKKHTIHGFTFIIGEISVEDFELKGYPSTSLCKPERILGEGFKDINVTYCERYSICSELQKVLPTTPLLKKYFNWGIRISHSIDIGLSRIKLQETAAYCCERANHELLSWIDKDLEKYRARIFQGVKTEIQEAIDRVNEDTIKCFSKSLSNHIGDVGFFGEEDEGDSQLAKIKEKIRKKEKEIEDLYCQICDRKNAAINEYLDQEKRIPKSFLEKIRKVCKVQELTS